MQIDVEATARAIRLSAYNAYMLCLGPSSEYHRLASEFFRSPRVGQLVVEVSTIYLDRNHLLAVGTLESTGLEPYDVDNQQDYVEEDGTINLPMEKVYYIRLLDGEVQRWVNASFIPVPCEKIF